MNDIQILHSIEVPISGEEKQHLLEYEVQYAENLYILLCEIATFSSNKRNMTINLQSNKYINTNTNQSWLCNKSIKANIKH